MARTKKIHISLIELEEPVDVNSEELEKILKVVRDIAWEHSERVYRIICHNKFILFKVHNN